MFESVYETKNLVVSKVYQIKLDVSNVYQIMLYVSKMYSMAFMKNVCTDVFQSFSSFLFSKIATLLQ